MLRLLRKVAGLSNFSFAMAVLTEVVLCLNSDCPTGSLTSSVMHMGQVTVPYHPV